MNKVIDKRLYFNTLRQTRVFGILAVIAAAIVGISYTVSTIMDTPKSQTYYADIADTNVLLFLSFSVVAPLLTVYAFRFCTTRAGSDFYFSIPKTRTQIFFSVYFAVMTWVVFALIVACAVPLVLLFTDNIVLSVPAVLKNFAKLFLSCFMVMSAVSIAVGVSGTQVFAVFFALIIIFVPRIFIITILSAAQSGVPFVYGAADITLLSPNATLPFGYIYNYFYFPKGITPIIYTFVLGVVYLFIGYKLFLRRPSECATKPAVSKKIRALLRITVSSFINLIFVFGLCNFIFGTTFYPEDIFGYIILLILSVGAYMLCELFTTKSAKAMVKVLPSYVIVIGITVAVCAVSSFIKLSYVNYTPTADDISYVSIDTNQDEYDYFTAKKSKIEFTDKKIVSAISEKLKENSDAYKSYGENWFYGADGIHSSYCLNVKINDGAFSHSRILYMSEEDYNEINEMLLENAEYSKIFSDLPDNPAGVNCSELDAPAAERAKIYQAFLSDIAKGNATAADVQYSTTAYSGIQFDVTYVENGKSYTVNFSITDKFPTAYKEYLKIAQKNGNKKNIEKIVGLGDKCEELTTGKLICENPANYSVNDEDFKTLREYLKKAKIDGITASDITYYVTAVSDNYEYINGIFALDRKTAAEFEKTFFKTTE